MKRVRECLLVAAAVSGSVVATLAGCGSDVTVDESRTLALSSAGQGSSAPQTPQTAALDGSAGAAAAAAAPRERRHKGGGTGGGNRDGSGQPTRGTLVVDRSAIQIDGAEITDRNGRRWKVRHITHDLKDVPDNLGGIPKAMDEMTDEELADALRPVRYEADDDDVWEYSALNVLPSDLESVRDSRAKVAAGLRYRAFRDRPMEGEYLPPDERPEAKVSYAPRPAPQATTNLSSLIQLPDDRTWVWLEPLTLFPMNAVSATSRTGSIGGVPQPFGNSLDYANCTITNIGKWTALGAAHCVYGPTYPGSAFGAYSYPMWSLNHREYHTGSASGPLTKQYLMHNPRGTTNYGCYAITTNAYFKTWYFTTPANNLVDWDYAYWDFLGNQTCGDKPGDPAGSKHGNFVPLGNGSSADYAGNYGVMYAYDGNKPCGGPADGCINNDDCDQSCVYPSNPAISNRYYSDPSMIGRYISSGGITSASIRQLSVDMDAVAGASGAGILQPLFTSVGDGTIYYTGVYSYWSSGIGQRARKVDAFMVAGLYQCASEVGGNSTCTPQF